MASAKRTIDEISSSLLENTPLDYCLPSIEQPVEEIKRSRMKTPHGYCIQEGCQTRAFYRYPGTIPKLYCATHKKPGMVYSTLCKANGCVSSSPSFNYPGTKKGIFCGKHREVGMVDVKSRRCLGQEGECPRLNPSYNYPGETRGMYCAKHRTAEMISFEKRRVPRTTYSKNPCKVEGCPIQNACFNYSGIRRGIYCINHCEPGMVNVKFKLCKEAKCKSRIPKFNFPGELEGVYCEQHAKEGMENVCLNKVSRHHIAELSELLK
jgi:hypothetical protein